MTDSSSLTQAEIIARRTAKLAKVREAGAAFPNDFVRSHSIAAARQLPVATAVALAGRLILRRKAGKATFANLADGSEDLDGAGNTIQLYVNEANADAFAVLNELDFGDIIGVTGKLFLTKKEELTVQLEHITLLSKCLQPFNVKDNLSAEFQSKRRYLALALQPELRNRFRARSQLICLLASYFNQCGYLEVETPMLHQVQGGAAAKPFVTRHASLDQQLFLRIAPELYLKRLLVGGFDKVFEINRCFRNEGMSEQHNPEFTMLECYAAYQTYTDYMDFVEEALRSVAADFYAATGLEAQVDLSAKFARLSLAEAVSQYCACSLDQSFDKEFLTNLLVNKEGDKAAGAIASGDVGRLQLLAFETFVEDQLTAPTFITGYPASVSPLARRRAELDHGIEMTDRFELFIGGREIANGFSELNDPDLQHAVFEDQVAQAQAGDEEAMQYDADYIRALRYGMPPAAGAGIGIDRLTMLLLGIASIREAILFPQQRPEG